MPDISNPNKSNLDQQQIIQRAFDELTDRLRVDTAVSIQNGQAEVLITHEDDSIRLGDGTSLITSTNVAGKQSLDVNVTQSALPTGAATEAKQNTIISELQDIEAEIETSNTILTQIENNTDDIETKLDATNASLDAIESDMDAIRIATQSIDADIDVTLSTRASESTLSNVLTQVTAINANTDTIETLITSTNTKLDATNTSLDNIEADIDEINSKVSTSTKQDQQTLILQDIDNNTDEIEPKLDTVNSNLDSIETKLDAANTSLDNIEADADAIRIAVQSIDTDFDVALSTRATEATQLNVLSQLNDIETDIEATNTSLGLANASLDAIEADADVIRQQQIDGTQKTHLLAPDNTEADYNDGASTARTLRTTSNVKFDGTTPTRNAGTTDANTQRITANITRNGTELSYNTGAPDANTLRVVAASTDGSGNTITSTLGTTKRALDVVQVPMAANKYAVPISLRQTATTAANATVFAMRNPAASAKTIYIEEFSLNISFDAATPLGRQTLGYDFCRFSAATPTGGTSLTVIKMDNASSATAVTDVRFLDTGLTTTSVVFETPFHTLNVAAVSGVSATSMIEVTIPLVLAPGEGFCVRLDVAALVGQGLNGSIMWSER